jgi:hypothetical protein
VAATPATRAAPAANFKLCPKQEIIEFVAARHLLNYNGSCDYRSPTYRLQKGKLHEPRTMDAACLRALRRRGHSDASIAAMTPEEAFVNTAPTTAS